MTAAAHRSPMNRQTRSPGMQRPSSRSSSSRGPSAAEMKAERDWRILQDRIAKARTQDLRDPDGVWHRRCRALADDLDLDVCDVLDEWNERAAVREYLGEASREDANRLAFADVEERLTVQRVLL